jgi:hypothetical protein
MYIRGFNSLAAIFLFFLLHATSCTFSNISSFSLLSPVPGLPMLILILPSLCAPVLITPSPHPSYIPVQMAKSHISCHALPLCYVAILSKSAPAPESPSTPHHEFPGFQLHSSPAHYKYSYFHPFHSYFLFQVVLSFPCSYHILRLLHILALIFE